MTATYNSLFGQTSWNMPNVDNLINQDGIQFINNEDIQIELSKIQVINDIILLIRQGIKKQHTLKTHIDVLVIQIRKLIWQLGATLKIHRQLHQTEFVYYSKKYHFTQNDVLMILMELNKTDNYMFFHGIINSNFEIYAEKCLNDWFDEYILQAENHIRQFTYIMYVFFGI